MSIYTRTGNLGETGLNGGPRVGKDHYRIEALGAIDELSAAIGIARAFVLDKLDKTEEIQSKDKLTNLDSLLERIEMELLIVGGELSTPYPKREGIERITQTHIDFWEQEIERFPEVEPHFILPPKSKIGAFLFQARATARSAERRVVGVVRRTPAGELVNPLILTYLNILSDILFLASSQE